MEPVLRASPAGLSLIWISWPQLTAIQAGAPASVIGLPLNVIGQPGTGGRGAGKRTWTPLLARAPASGASSRNWSLSEKSPYGRAAYQSTPRPGSPGPALIVPSRCSVIE